jgi:hypothetical protein
MPFVFIIVGAVLVTSGVRGTSQDLLNLLKGDLTGQNNFIYWVLAILLIGSLGYVDELRGFSRALLALIIIVLVVHEQNQGGSGGLFTEFQNAVKQITGG